jgi:hypothetical protein
MYGITLVESALALLAALLIALLFSTPAAPFAAAHTTGHAKAKARPETGPCGPSGPAPCGAVLTVRHGDPAADPAVAPAPDISRTPGASRPSAAARRVRH